MALTGEVQIGRINRFFTKWLGAKGSSPRMTIGGELIGVIPLWSGVENRFLDSWGTFGFAQFIAAQAAATVGFRLHNPGKSGVIAVVEKWSIAVGASQNVTLSVSNTVDTDLTTASVGSGRGDGRGVLVPVCIPSSSLTSPVSLGSLIGQFQLGVANPYDIITDEDQEIGLTQGSSLQVVTNTVNIPFFVSIWWRERALEDSEKQ
jgi:hypothetical protein